MKINVNNMLKRILHLVFLSLIVAGCQTTGPQPDAALDPQPAASLVAPPGPELTHVAPPPPDSLWARMRPGFSWHRTYGLQPQVAAARERFLAQTEFVPAITRRAALYLHYIVTEVERRGLPMELALLPVVESSLLPGATSSSGAAGLWQIMPGTGRYLGLEQNWWYDGRRDIRRSTDAALDYLTRLHQEFDGDWLLALAAYNSGRTRVQRARVRHHAAGRDTGYWSLDLPLETRHYVPKLIALADLRARPEKWALRLPPLANEAGFAVVRTGGQVELARVAHLAGVEQDLVAALNPGHLRWATAPEQAGEILLPVEIAAGVEQVLLALPPDERVSWRHYRIQPGDTLSTIARRMDSNVALLRAVNAIRGSLIRAGDTLLIPRGSTWADSLRMTAQEQPRKRAYRVRRGDSLYRIAGRFNVSVHDIVSWNALDPEAYLQPGQRLTLYVSDG